MDLGRQGRIKQRGQVDTVTFERRGKRGLGASLMPIWGRKFWVGDINLPSLAYKQY